MTVWIYGHGMPDLTASMFESNQRPREPTWINANSGLLLCEKLNCALHSRHMKSGTSRLNTRFETGVIQIPACGAFRDASTKPGD